MDIKAMEIVSTRVQGLRSYRGYFGGQCFLLISDLDNNLLGFVAEKLSPALKRLVDRMGIEVSVVLSLPQGERLVYLVAASWEACQQLSEPMVMQRLRGIVAVKMGGAA